MKYTRIFLVFFLFTCCTGPSQHESKKYARRAPFLWENATVYFLLTDRFCNGDSSNDYSFGRKRDGAALRSFNGGDLRGIIRKINEGYFDQLGITALWMTPVFEQIHGFTNEGWGRTYAYHGYWIRDWTSLDPNFGSMNDLKELVETAHNHGIRILMDIIINHTGPVTPTDTQWPDSWVRTTPVCTYKDYRTCVPCTLSHLPDIRTESDKETGIPEFLVNKWRKEGRYEKEIKELERFFNKTGYPKAPRFYIIKWLTDYVRKFGIDGFRVDTAKHTEAGVWDELYKEALEALLDWKSEHADKKLDDLDFYMVGEVYGYHIQNGRLYNYGDTSIDFFSNGFKSLINFGFKSDASGNWEELFSSYSRFLNGVLRGKSVLNYLSSHDDGSPFDLKREKAFEAGTKLMLAPGAAQIYYGDETARSLTVEQATGDANLRSDMNWNELDKNVKKNGYFIRDVFDHWCKLGQFRKEHPSVGAGIHHKLNDNPYVFYRQLDHQGIRDKVVVALGLINEPINVRGVFQDDTELKDYYSGNLVKVKNGMVDIRTANKIVLLGIPL